MRVMFCEFCKTVEELPDYAGNNPVDPYVEELVMAHNRREPMAHGGSGIEKSPIRLLHFSDSDWVNSRDKCLQLAVEQNKKDGFNAWAYEAANTFAEDAMACFGRHGRPAEGCIDYFDDSKRIGRPSPEGRRAVKNEYKLGEKDPHICQFCPVQSWVTLRQNDKAGLYR